MEIANWLGGMAIVVGTMTLVDERACSCVENAEFEMIGWLGAATVIADLEAPGLVVEKAGCCERDPDPKFEMAGWLERITGLLDAAALVVERACL